MTDSFDSPITQYDKSFDHLFVNGARKGMACSYFSIFTAWRYMKKYEPTLNVHIDNVTNAVNVSRDLFTSTGISFNELLENYTSLKSNDIAGCTTELIASKEVKYTDIFPESDKKYAMIFLKNEKYIVVLVNKNNYYVRDCHETKQCNFTSLDSLAQHLETIYQFATSINIDGIHYYEYSSIEYLKVDDEFDTFLSGMLNIDVAPDFVVNTKLVQLNQSNQLDPVEKTLSEKDMEYLMLLNEQFNSDTVPVQNDKYDNKYDSKSGSDANSYESYDEDDFVAF